MIMKSAAEGADHFFLTIENSRYPPPRNTWQMMTFLNPLDALIPKIPFSFMRNFGSGPPPGPGGQSL